MNLTEQDVEHVARLARLIVTEDEKHTLAGELGRILEHADELGALDLTGVAPMSHVGDRQTAMRPDEPAPSLPPEITLANAPDADEQQFRVPAVLEG